MGREVNDKSMLKMKFKFDEEKLKINNPDLGVELLTELLDDICLNTRFIKTGICEYELPEDESTVGTLLILSARFDKQSWLYPNLKSWRIYDKLLQHDDLHAAFNSAKIKDDVEYNDIAIAATESDDIIRGIDQQIKRNAKSR